MRARAVVVSIVTSAFVATPAFASSFLTGTAGAKAECTMRGTAANDRLFGTTRADVICTRAGRDLAAGFGGNDVVRGGSGFDIIEGDDGSDTVRGQADDDFVCGNDANDDLFGGQGADNLGGSNNDCFSGLQDASPGPNNQYETGDDFLKTRDNVSGNDFVDGGENTDVCVIDSGDTVLNCEE
jgi:Ca2+-binding RTX toxin-like protein